MKACYSNIFEQNFESAAGDLVKINRIVVPKIQRAYAQGRKDETYIRNTFLKDIFNHLVSGEEMDLNFIYGAIKQFENTTVFELIDGQQRTTTLFLLHWYIANRELDNSSDEYLSICKKLSLFSYETRVTSTDFCHMLASYRGGVRDYLPSKVLKQSKWYFRAYDKDATVECMLNMLDAIHNKYEEILASNPDIKLFGNLDKLQFQVLSLGQFGLTEELYIKMNSRGLPLSSFDNFKAELTGYLKNSPIGNEQVKMSGSISGFTVPFYTDFSSNLDTNWINVFWNIEDQEFDAKYFKFFHLYLGYKYLLEAPNVAAADMKKDDTVKFFLAEDNFSEKYKGFEEYKKIFDVHPEYFKKISNVLNVFSEHYSNDILPNTAPSWEADKAVQGFFGKTTQTTNIVFFATTEFIEAYPSFDLTTYKQWMRVVRNIVENSETDNFSVIAGVIRNLSKIIKYTASCSGFSFYEALNLYGEEDPTRLSSKSIKEEVIKAGRIAEDAEWEAIFIEAEKHPFLKGTTSFFYSDNIGKDVFKHRLTILKDILTENGASSLAKSEGHIFLRSLISKISSWKEIWDVYIPDKSEAHRYFKNWLTNTSSIHDFICELFDSDDTEATLAKMRLAVSMGSSLTDPIQKRIHTTLYKNGNLQDWLQTHDAVRLRWFKDNIYMMKPNSPIYKVMLDTERNRFVQDIVENFYYEYVDPSQSDFWQSTTYYYGNEVALVKRTAEAEILLTFSTESQYHVKVKASTAFRRGVFQREFGIDDTQIIDGYVPIITSKSYAGSDAYSRIKVECLERIEDALNQ